MTKQLEPKDFPSIYVASDTCAIKAQKQYYRTARLKILLLIGIATIAAFSWTGAFELRSTAAGLVALLLVLGLIIDAVVLSRRYDRVWFNSRSIAETVKSQAWFYATKTKPYNQQDAASEEEFYKSLKRILEREKEVPQEISEELAGGVQITDAMKRTRHENLLDRVKHYSENRIVNQRIWYSSKSKWNRNREFRWYMASVVLQLIAAVLAIVIIFDGTIPLNLGHFSASLNPIGILTTLTAGTLTWSQARRFGELAKSYGLIATSLVILEGEAKSIDSENLLQQLVLDVERTISREHEIWLTRGLRQ